MFEWMRLLRGEHFLALSVFTGQVAACSASNDDPLMGEGSTTGELESTDSSGVETSGLPDAESSSSSSSSSSGGDTEPFDGFGPPVGLALEEVVVNQGVAIPVWNADEGVLDGDRRSAPLLQNRPAGVFARFSVSSDWEPREVTARLH